MKLNYNDLCKIYDEMVVTNGEDYWKYLVIEYMVNRGNTKFETTEEEIENIVNDIMNNDEIFDMIDNCIADNISPTIFDYEKFIL